MGILKIIPLVGSLFVRRSEDGGKTQVAAIPTGLAIYTLTGVACIAQSSEPFSQCVERVWPLLGGLFS